MNKSRVPTLFGWAIEEGGCSTRPTRMAAGERRTSEGVKSWSPRSGWLRQFHGIPKYAPVLLAGLFLLFWAFTGRLGQSVFFTIAAMFVGVAGFLVWIPFGLVSQWRTAIPRTIMADAAGFTLCGETETRVLAWEQITGWTDTGAVGPLVTLNLIQPPSLLVNLSGYSRRDIQEMRREVRRRLNLQ